MAYNKVPQHNLQLATQVPAINRHDGSMFYRDHAGGRVDNFSNAVLAGHDGIANLGVCRSRNGVISIAAAEIDVAFNDSDRHGMRRCR